MRILIIEDDSSIIDYLKPSLKGEGFIVDAVEDGEDGSYVARTNDYDLIILDNYLPKKNGCQVCDEIRKDGKNVPIIMLSVGTEVGTKVELLNTGADDYLTKPFSFEELLARIKALLRRPRKIENKILKIGDLILDRGRQTVFYGKKEIYLTRKEICLLEYLMENKGMVMSRGLIMEHVWDRDADPFSNTIESHILNLRKKIKSKSKREFIHSVSGRGYKIG